MIATTAMTPASTKAELISRPASWIVTGVPVTSGATVRIEATNRLSASLSRASPRGKISTRARPSGAIQGSRNSGGNVSSVTGPAVMTRRSVSSRSSSPVIRSRCSAGIIAGPRSAAPSRALARRRAALCGPTVAASRAATGCRALRRLAIAARISSLVGSGSVVSGLNVGPRRSWRSARIASFCSWSAGIKLAAVITCDTSGSFDSLPARVCASCNDDTIVWAV